jgi:demethylmenaquinone methyltransferase/2-methoxy-6-polyprenyl-1,4-benzoquinol methylase
MKAGAAEKPWERTGETKRTYVRRMFGEISPTYDLLNGAMSFGRHHKWREAAVRGMNLSRGASAADVCTGTGDFANPLRKVIGDVGHIVGLDFSEPMLVRGREKPFALKPLAGDACALPLRRETFDAVTVGWGLRNVPDLATALFEIHRVLKPGGKFAAVDMSRPTRRAMRLISSILFRRAVPLLGALFGKREAYTYLPESTARFVSPEEVEQLMKEVGFTNVRTSRRMLGNICIWWGEK